MRPGQQGPERRGLLALEAQRLQLELRRAAVEQADDDLLAELGGQAGDAQVDVFGAHPERRPAVLRTAALGNVHARDDLQPRQHRRLVHGRDAHDIFEDAVDAAADLQMMRVRFDMDVAGPDARGFAEDDVHQLDDRRPRRAALRRLRLVLDHLGFDLARRLDVPDELIEHMVAAPRVAGTPEHRPLPGLGRGRRNHLPGLDLDILAGPEGHPLLRLDVRGDLIDHMLVEHMLAVPWVAEPPEHRPHRRLRRDRRRHPLPGAELDVLDGAVFERVRHGEAQTLWSVPDGHHAPLATEFNREPGRRVGRHLGVRREVGHPQPAGHRRTRLLFVHQPERGERADQRAAIARLRLVRA